MIKAIKEFFRAKETEVTSDYYIVGATTFQSLMTVACRGEEATSALQLKHDGYTPFLHGAHVSFEICLDLSKPESYLEEVSEEYLHNHMKVLVKPWMSEELFNRL